MWARAVLEGPLLCKVARRVERHGKLWYLQNRIRQLARKDNCAQVGLRISTLVWTMLHSLHVIGLSGGEMKPMSISCVVPVRE